MCAQATPGTPGACLNPEPSTYQLIPAACCQVVIYGGLGAARLTVETLVDWGFQGSQWVAPLLQLPVCQADATRTILIVVQFNFRHHQAPHSRPCILSTHGTPHDTQLVHMELPAASRRPRTCCLSRAC
jgi:hypothetical protein